MRVSSLCLKKLSALVSIYITALLRALVLHQLSHYITPIIFVAVGRRVFIYPFNFSRVKLSAVPTAFASAAAHEIQSTETVTTHHDLKGA